MTQQNTGSHFTCVMVGINNLCSCFASPQQVSQPPTSMASTTPNDDYQWPANLYIEMRDMASASFMVYTIAYVVDVARKVGSLKGLEVSDEGRVDMPSRDLFRSFSPGEVLDIVQDNREALKENYKSVFGDEISYEQITNNLRTLKGQYSTN